jgi:predicted dehydrogenase
VDRTRVAVVGAGFFADNHLNAWTQLAGEGAELVAVCDLDRARAERAAARFGGKPYTDAATLLREARPDLVDIVTQMHAHRQLVDAAAAAGVGTIVQKPLAPSWEDCVAIAEAATAAGVFFAVHENFRFQTPMRRVRALIGKGAIGAPAFARISFRTGFDVYRGQPYLMAERRFAILDVGIHVLDLARAFLGEVARVSCETQARREGIAGEDSATMLLRHAGGAVSVVDCTYAARREPDPFPETVLEIEGETGSLVMAPGTRLSVTAGGRAWTEDAGAPLLPWTERPWHVAQEGVLGACRHFLACFREGRAPETDAADNLATYALVEAAYAAAATGRAVVPARWSPAGSRPQAAV